MKRAKEAMAQGAKGTSKVVEGMGFVAGKVGEGVGVIVGSKGVQKTVEVVKGVGETVQKVAVDPLLETRAARAVASSVSSIKKDLASPESAVLDLTSSETRAREKQERIESAKHMVSPNTEATAVTVTDSPAKDASASWTSRILDATPLGGHLASLSRAISDSENPVISRARDTYLRVTSALTSETEEAKVIRAIRECDPKFRKEAFLAEATRYIIPEVLEAVLKGDLATVRDWCSEKVYAELSASVQLQKSAGLVSDCKLLDLSRVDIRAMKFNEEAQLPFLHMTFTTQEILLFRDRKTGEIKLGTEDMIESPIYNIFITKAQFVDEAGAAGVEGVSAPVSFNPATGGWKIIGWMRSQGGW